MDSLFANNLSQCEIILVNDGSKDDFFGWAEKYFSCALQEQLPVQKVNWMNSTVQIITQPNKGVSAARNAGINHATGEYLLFVDPDDTVMPDYIATIAQEVAGNDCDFLLFGFQQIWENEDATAIYQEILPKREYSISSTEEAIAQLLPNYIGRSLISINHWLKTGEFNPYEEYGSVWRCVYRRELIRKNNIQFKENLCLNEDQFFNCEYIAHMQTGKSCMTALYNYVLRSDGAMRKQWGKTLPSTRQALLEEREQLCRYLRNRGYGQISYLWYAGTNVFTVFEILRRGDLAYWNEMMRYILHPTVQKSIKEAPISLRKPVYFVMILLLKLRLYMVLFWCYKSCGRFGIKFNLCR
jgi:glycosyltransferase involved in cell wall biosynthesis